MKTFPNMFLLLQLTLIFLSFIYFSKSNASNDLSCHPNDQAALLKIRDHFGGPNGPLSDWHTNSDCCIDDWEYVGCLAEHQGSTIGRVIAVTFGSTFGVSGTIPAEFGDLPFLGTLWLDGDLNITGPIPNSFSKLKKLRSLKLNSNNLSGPIPTFLGRLKRLEEVDLSNNKLSGVIPASLATLPSLSQLNVSSNQLCGAIATGLKKFEKSMFEHNKCLCGAPLAACKWGLPASI